MLDQATEQMAAPQREDHSGDITTLRLKSPLEHTHTHAQWQRARSFCLLSVFVNDQNTLGFFVPPMRKCFFLSLPDLSTHALSYGFVKKSRINLAQKSSYLGHE